MTTTVTSTRRTLTENWWASTGRWLRLAAAPTFAVMAVAALVQPADPLLCLTGASHSGMAVMYLLMGVFHLHPWLAIFSSQLEISGRGTETQERE